MEVSSSIGPGPGPTPIAICILAINKLVRADLKFINVWFSIASWVHKKCENFIGFINTIMVIVVKMSSLAPSDMGQWI